MGLRCLLGHDFGEPETERERNEEGNEVVVTVREVKTCERCGEKQVVSENKEITSIDQLRESAAGEQPQEDSAPKVGIGTDAEEEWGDDDLTTGQTEPATAETEPEQSGEESATVEPDEDPIERGVADIIEQAEKDDDMLEQSPEEPDSASEPTAEEAAGDEPEDESDDAPVHPGQRSAAAEESDAPDPAEDDGVILDDDAASPPEEGRHQWEEEASPEEVPGDELSVGDASTPEEPDENDAEIIDASSSPSESSPAEPESEPSTPEDEPQGSSTPSAVESEDAEIVDADPEPSGSEPSESQSEPAPTEREETDEGHMPWPEGPGEDEGHDATPPEGEPADVDFGDFVPTEEQSSDPEADRANGHRTDEGESSERSTAPTANVDLERSSRDAELEYFCPECGLTRDVGTSSMRAGDICPECHIGYISEQQKAE
ncbi:DUF7093 family protein [Halolamina salina]|uniref:Oxidoreductase n=1 Tax=Halolamina salina TaxID=1220023 RepID=A0ABD6B4T3_9EURY